MNLYRNETEEVYDLSLVNSSSGLQSQLLCPVLFYFIFPSNGFRVTAVLTKQAFRYVWCIS